MRLCERPRFQPAEMRAPRHAPPHQTGALQRLDVLGGRRKRHVERCGQLADAALAIGEMTQNPPPGGIAQRVEDGVTGTMFGTGSQGQTLFDLMSGR